MFAEPTPNDFLAWVNSLLDKATNQARRGVEQIERDAARTGQTGNAIARTFKQVRAQFEAGIEDALGALQRAVRETKLDPSMLRQLTVQQLQNFLLVMKAATKSDQMQRFGPGVQEHANKELAALDTYLQYAVRQFDVGFLRPIEPEAPTIMTNNTMTIGSVSGGSIQQGSHGVLQNISFHISTVSDFLGAFERALAEANLPGQLRGDLVADARAIRSQLAKVAPSHPILLEAGKSIRKVLEGAATGAATAGVTAAARSLFAAIGLS